MSPPGRRSTGNAQKHASSNPIQQRLIARFHREVARLVESVSPDEILEIGCGEGYVLDALLAGGITARLHGVDLDAEAIDEARHRLPETVTLDVADARDIMVDRPPDLVMMLEVLEHLDEPQSMLHSLTDLTGGKVLLSVPWEPYFRGLNLLRLKNVRRLGNDPEHVNHWGRSSFHRFVDQHFVIDEVGHAFPWLLLLATPRPRTSASP